LAKTYERTGRDAHPRSFTPLAFDLDFGFGLSQSRETANSKQVRSPDTPIGTESESELRSGPYTPIERSP